MVKGPSELELLATACRISDQAIADVFARIRPGLTERQLAAALDRRMVDLGAERPAFDTIVASGPNGAIPHHAPTDRPMRRGDLITMDFGALYGGYHADMTRTVALGEPAGWQREIYELVAAAQRAGIEAARPGADVADVDAAARDLIRDAGHGEHFGHGLGHGVGLEVHEAPTIGYSRTGKLAERVPVTVEPGVYVPGRGGVRIEDVLVVGAGGSSGRACSRRLRENFSSFYLETERGHHERPEERHDLEPRRRALDRRGVPARQAGQGPRLRAHQAEERHLGQGGRPDLQRRRQGRRGHRSTAARCSTCTARAPTSCSWTRRTTTSRGSPPTVVGDAANYLLEEQTVTVAFNDGTPLYVDLPAAVELTISQTDPGVQGDRSTGGTKPATLETGATIQVPLFISTGEKIKVDTRTGQYLGRA